jgi:hypothetical protein
MTLSTDPDDDEKRIITINCNGDAGKVGSYDVAILVTDDDYYKSGEELSVEGSFTITIVDNLSTSLSESLIDTTVGLSEEEAADNAAYEDFIANFLFMFFDQSTFD